MLKVGRRSRAHTWPWTGVLPLLLLVVGCVKAPSAGALPALPDEVSKVPVQPPLNILQEAAQLDDPTPRARALAGLILGSEDPGGGSWSQQALSDPDPWVQRAAVDALAARLPETAAADGLIQWARSGEANAYVRSLAAVHLATLGSDDARSSLSDAWRSEARGWIRAPLAFGALTLGDDEAAEPLSEALSQGELALEIDFVIALGASGHIELLPALQEGSERVEPELELAYAAARLLMGDPAGEGPLRAALAEGVERRLEALDVLSRLEVKESIPLLRRARSSGPDLVRQYAELTLAAREGRSTGPFVEAAADADREVRALALRLVAHAAVRSGDRRLGRAARRLTTAGLHDEATDVRLAALRAIAELGPPLEAVDLEANLTHPSLLVRIEAAALLVQEQR